MKPVLDGSVIGRNHFWMKVSLDETVFGRKCFWMKVFLDECFCNLDESEPNHFGPKIQFKYIDTKNQLQTY